MEEHFDAKSAFENVMVALRHAQANIAVLEEKVTSQIDLNTRVMTENAQLQATLEELEARVEYLEAINGKNGLFQK